MAVLTSPRRTRPRFGPQAGLVAATRGVAFTGLMLAGLGLLIVIVAAVFLTALGAGILIVGNGGPQDSTCCWPSSCSAPGSAWPGSPCRPRCWASAGWPA